MRLMIAAAMIAASPVAGSGGLLETAGGQGGGDRSVGVLPTLTQGEVLLEVSGLGLSVSPATSATLTVTATGRGETREAAERAREEEVRRLTAAARAAGGAGTDVRVTPGFTAEIADTFDGAEMNMLGDEDLNFSVATERQPSFHATSDIEVVLSNPSRARAVAAAIGAAGIYGIGDSIVYALADDAAQQRAARAQAIANARANAEAYAASLNMRIVRVLRVTERAGLDFAALAFTQRSAARLVERPSNDPIIRTFAVVGVDFVLAAR